MKNARLIEQFLGRLASSEEILGLFELLPEHSFFVKDRRGRFIALNRRACEYCGVASSEGAIGRSDHDFFPKRRADQYRQDDVAVMKSGQAIVNRIESAPEVEGSPRLVMTSKAPLRDRRGRVIGVAGISRQVEDLRAPAGTADAFAQVMEHLHSHFHESLTTEHLARRAGLSPSQFERRFRRAFGCSPRQYLMRVRVENASRMLSESEQTVSQIAQACGFYDHAHFSRTFRRLMSVTPTAYRKTRRPTRRV